MNWNQSDIVRSAEAIQTVSKSPNSVLFEQNSSNYMQLSGPLYVAS